MVAILSHHFTWPGIREDIRAYCRACPECQKAGRQLQPRVPTVVTPTISEPYQRMAWDLVGKLDKTNPGHMYILTIMCLGTRYLGHRYILTIIFLGTRYLHRSYVHPYHYVSWD